MRPVTKFANIIVAFRFSQRRWYIVGARLNLQKAESMTARIVVKIDSQRGEP